MHLQHHWTTITLELEIQLIVEKRSQLNQPTPLESEMTPIRKEFLLKTTNTQQHTPHAHNPEIQESEYY